EGEVLDMLVQRRRDKRAALRLMRKLLSKQGFVPKSLTTDKLGSYGSAFRHLRLTTRSCGDESVKCRGSSRLALPSAFSICTLPSITRSTFNATSSPDRRYGSSEPKRQRKATRRCSSMTSDLDPLPSSPNARYRDNAALAMRDRRWCQGNLQHAAVLSGRGLH